MKIQSLAIIFVLIILPISIVLSEYVQAQINTLNVQTSYDSQLLSATYDAVIAFQKNTVNSWSSDITSSKMRDIEASANVFLNSVANNFGMSGNTKDAIKEFIPAIVYTLYDGYYIYTPFNNELGDIEVNGSSSYQDDVRIFGLKPYIYYSREYNKDSNNNFVITYTLDNYITVQGKVNGEIVNKGGYLIDTSKTSSDGSRYRDADIKNGQNDKVYEYIDKDHQYQCVKVNGTKYYLDGDRVFSYINNEPSYLNESDSFIDNYFNNYNSAQEYYREAYEFTNWVRDKLGTIMSSDAKDYSSEDQANYVDIFKVDNIEYYNSNFNQERRAVIKKSIEKNLASSIANFSNITSAKGEINFQMPKLKDDEWDKVINNVSVITFLQGLNMGTRQYNGYAIVPNNKNEEFVGEESIYIVANNEYHRVNDKDLLQNGVTLKQGIFNMNFERKAIDEVNEDGSSVGKQYFYPIKDEMACYNSIVNQSNVNSLVNGDGTPMSIYEYLSSVKNESNGKELASLYYTALGRERQGMSKIY